MQKENPCTGSAPKSWWQTPWSFRESLAVVAGFILVGWLLQLTIGDFNYEIIRFPVNATLLGFIFFFVLLITLKHKSAFFNWLSGIPLSISTIAGLLLMGLIMGLIPQASPTGYSHDLLGFDAVTCSWAFVLVYFLTLVNLSCVVARRLLHFTWRDYAFYLNHIGLLLLLMSAGFGAADLRRYVMYVEEGNTEWRVYNEDKEVLELPVAIKLTDFYMEEYIPKLAILDKSSGNAIPKAKPQMIQIDTLQPVFEIAGWKIEVKEYQHEAIRNSDSTYRYLPMPGSCPAVLVTVTNPKEEVEEKTGWVCCGNFAQLYMALELNEQLSLVMTRPEPKLFRSDIVVYTENEKKVSHQLEVNKPLSIDNWMIYQHGYDVDRGRASTWSSFELVYDPWLLWEYIGLWTFIAGSVLLMWEGKKKKGNRDTLQIMNDDVKELKSNS